MLKSAENKNKILSHSSIIIILNWGTKLAKNTELVNHQQATQFPGHVHDAAQTTHQS